MVVKPYSECCVLCGEIKELTVDFMERVVCEDCAMKLANKVLPKYE